MTTIIRDVFLLNDFAKGQYRVVPQTERRFDTSESPLPLPEKTTPYESEYEAARREAHRQGDGPLPPHYQEPKS